MRIGASIVIGLIGLSLLLTALEQVRERRHLLAVLVAFGTRRSTLSWSVLWQSALPVALGIAIAVATGIALGSVLLRILGATVQIAWGDVAAMAGVGVVVVLLVTGAVFLFCGAPCAQRDCGPSRVRRQASPSQGRGSMKRVLLLVAVVLSLSSAPAVAA